MYNINMFVKLDKIIRRTTISFIIEGETDIILIFFIILKKKYIYYNTTFSKKKKWIG